MASNTDLWKFQRWIQVPRRNKHLLLTAHNHHNCSSMGAYLMAIESEDEDNWINQQTEYYRSNEKEWKRFRPTMTRTSAYNEALSRQGYPSYHWRNHDITTTKTTFNGGGMGGDWWSGATDADSEGTFYWQHSREQIVFEKWNPGDPSGGTTENCVLKVYLGNWQDYPCSMEFPYICEK
ncbi:aggrecan core protein-like [Saccostrea echinata]|uniref:aggrecan core protein-like n=1 Tax=Saccostrea echinata TaxID=191078 RepID=UPI002A810F55|nr:aggrecan core protein-like [Saccostrea echinata]